MGLLDEVLSMAGSSSTQQSQQHATVLGAIISYINSPQVGGLAGLQNMFQQGGLGHIISSWITPARTCLFLPTNCKMSCTAAPCSRWPSWRAWIPRSSPI
jgi:hypothetical protein